MIKRKPVTIGFHNGAEDPGGDTLKQANSPICLLWKGTSHFPSSMGVGMASYLGECLLRITPKNNTVWCVVVEVSVSETGQRLVAIFVNISIFYLQLCDCCFWNSLKHTFIDRKMAGPNKIEKLQIFRWMLFLCLSLCCGKCH